MTTRAGSDFHSAKLVCPADSRVIRDTHARMHARSHENWGREARQRRGGARDTRYLPLSSTITPGWSKPAPPGAGISEIIISQSLAGWQICRRGVKCHLLRDRGIGIDFFHGYMRVRAQKNTILMRFEFSKADRIELRPSGPRPSGLCFGIMIRRRVERVQNISALEIPRWIQ